ncbi:hypothetical protein AAY473_028821 [Plecturocebus cupreus]
MATPPSPAEPAAEQGRGALSSLDCKYFLRAYRVAGTPGVYHHAQLNFKFIVEMESCCVAQAGLEHLASSSPHALTSVDSCYQPLGYLCGFVCGRGRLTHLLCTLYLRGDALPVASLAETAFFPSLRLDVLC